LDERKEWKWIIEYHYKNERGQKKINEQTNSTHPSLGGEKGTLLLLSYCFLLYFC